MGGRMAQAPVCLRVKLKTTGLADVWKCHQMIKVIPLSQCSAEP